MKRPKCNEGRRLRRDDGDGGCGCDGGGGDDDDHRYLLMCYYDASNAASSARDGRTGGRVNVNGPPRLIAGLYCIET